MKARLKLSHDRAALLEALEELTGADARTFGIPEYRLIKARAAISAAKEKTK